MQERQKEVKWGAFIFHYLVYETAYFTNIDATLPPTQPTTP